MPAPPTLSRRPVVDVDYTPERAEHITLNNVSYDFLAANQLVSQALMCRLGSGRPAQSASKSVEVSGGVPPSDELAHHSGLEAGRLWAANADEVLSVPSGGGVEAPGRAGPGIPVLGRWK